MKHFCKQTLKIHIFEILVKKLLIEHSTIYVIPKHLFKLDGNIMC